MRIRSKVRSSTVSPLLRRMAASLPQYLVRPESPPLPMRRRITW